MTSLGALLIVLMSMFVAVMIGIAAVLLVKNKTANSIIFIALALLTMLISYLGATSMASNYIFAQIVGWSWGVMALAAIGTRFYAPRYAKYAKFLLVFASAASIIDLIFI